MTNVVLEQGLTEDPKFTEQLNGIIAEFETERNKAAKAAKEHGNRLKASPLLNLMEGGKFNADFIMAEFPKIANKTSTLPSSQREVIGSLVFNAAKRTVLLKQAERARKIEKRANERVAAEEAKQANQNQPADEVG